MSAPTTFSNSVAIGPEFFRKSFNDYRCKFWAFAREILQNSLDCGSGHIDIKVIEIPDDDRTLVIVTNDGLAMTRSTILDKLLSLGSSGKDFQDTVGGFGKAKEILYFAHKSYTIASGEWRVAGAGAGYNLTPGPFFQGTRSAVTWDRLVGDDLRAAFRRFIELCDRRKCAFTLDGEAITPAIPRFRRLRSLESGGEEWAQIGVHDFERGLLLVRIAGIPMFLEAGDYRQTLVLELSGNSGQRLTANRDSLRHPYSTRFRELITQMTVDRGSALKTETPVYTRYGGPRLRAVPASPSASPAIEDRGAAWVVAATAPPDAGGGIAVEPKGRFEAAGSVLPFAWVNKNCVPRKVPAEFDPLDVRFGDHAHWLARAWAGCLLELHSLLGKDDEFSCGFLFSKEAEAECEWSREYGRVYYVNPLVLTGNRSRRRRFTKADRGRIAAAAAHEAVHGARGLTYHGEEYANALTEVMGVVLNHWRRLARHFR